MPRPFKLIGNIPAKLSQIEKILPRIMARMNTKTYGIIPSSVIQVFSKTPDEKGMLVCGCAFKGTIKKIAIRVQAIDGKGTPEYSCVFYRENETSSFAFRTKKKSYVHELNVDVNDGDYFEIFQVNFTDIHIFGINIALLVDLDQKESKIHEVMTKNLLKDIEDEGI